MDTFDIHTAIDQSGRLSWLASVFLRWQIWDGTAGAYRKNFPILFPTLLPSAEVKIPSLVPPAAKTLNEHSCIELGLVLPAMEPTFVGRFRAVVVFG